MNTKSWIAVAILVALALVTFFWVQPVHTLAQLPEEGSLLVLMLVTAAVTWALVQLGTAFHIDLSGYTQPVAAVLSPILITLIEYYLQMIPSIYDNLVLSIIHLIVLFLGSIGTLIAINRRKNTKALLA